MRKILIFSFLALVLAINGNAQAFIGKIGSEVYCRIDATLKTPQFQEKTARIWHFTVTDASDSNLVILCQLLSYSREGSFDPFNTADSLLCRPNGSNDLEMMSILNRPFSLVLSKRGSVDQPDVRRVMEERIAAWQIQDNTAGVMRQNQLAYIWPEIRKVFISGDTVADHMGERKVDIMRLDPKGVRVRPFADEFLTAIVTSTRNSQALIVGPTYDSARIVTYFKKYDPLYGNMSIYKLIRLDLMMGCNLRDWYQRYDEALLTVDDSVLAPYPSHLFNKAQTVRNVSADSAYGTIRYLSRTKDAYHSWVQESFAQSFIEHGRIEEAQAAWRKDGMSEADVAKTTRQVLKGREISGELLARLAADGDTVIRDEVYPLYLWTEARKHGGNKDSVLQIAGALEKMRGSKKYSNHYRYALLVYKQLQASGQTAAAAAMLDREIGGMELTVKDSLDNEKDRYAVQNMLAYAYKLKSEAVRGTDTAESFNLLAKAAVYSPSSNKEKVYTSFYDRVFLDSKESYRPEFAEALMQQGHSKEGIKLLTQQVNADPGMLGDLQASFAKHYPNQDFYDFFNNIMVKTWKMAPGFTLKSPDGKTVHRLEDYRGRWLLLDFWGTWCGPCRAEMPEVDAFAKKIRDRKDLAFLSIACRDYPEPVTKYLDSKGYHFPVVMSDNVVDKAYEVPGYPAKILVSPGGTMLLVSFGQDWEKVVGEITALKPAPVKKPESKLLKQKVN